MKEREREREKKREKWWRRYYTCAFNKNRERSFIFVLNYHDCTRRYCTLCELIRL